MKAVDPVMLRDKMVERDVIGRGIADERVIAAMRAVPRHLFVDEALRGRAYLDQALPIGSRQTISRPSTVALMTALLGCRDDDRVLEIGTGSGYQSAVLARLCRSLDTIERIPALARRAKRLFASLGLRNVRVHESDGTLGLRGRAAYPRIVVTAGAPELPEALFAQLEEGGRLVVPVASAGGDERLQLVEKRDGERVVTEVAGCAFVPLIGAQGYEAPKPAGW